MQRTYDKNNRLTQVKTLDGAGAVLTERGYGYDWNGNLLTESLVLDGQSFSVGYTYDVKDHLATLTYPSSLVIDYLPDALGRPTQATPSATTVAFHPSGQVSAISFANAARTDLTFNNRYWPATLVHKDASAQNLVNSTYVYDGVGNITSITDSADSIYNRTLGYDDIDRVTTTTSTPVWGTGSVTYNGRGDILTQAQGAGFSLTYTYNATSGLLTSVSGSVAYPSITYDVYGNVTGNGVHTFAYDDAPSMTCSNCGSPDRIDYGYDGKGMRVKAVKSGLTTYSFYGASGNLLFEYDPAAAAFSDNVYLKDKLLAKRTPSSTVYFHDDLLGSPMAATDQAGALAWRENYRPYGSQLLGEGNATNSLWFTAKSLDQDTKLSYLGARYYDTQLGRFMGMDPAPFDETNSHSVNRYAYGNNNPYKFKDPSGLDPERAQSGGTGPNEVGARGVLDVMDRYRAEGYEIVGIEVTASLPGVDYKRRYDFVTRSKETGRYIGVEVKASEIAQFKLDRDQVNFDTAVLSTPEGASVRGEAYRISGIRYEGVDLAGRVNASWQQGYLYRKLQMMGVKPAVTIGPR